jgi:hypothetical protein
MAVVITPGTLNANDGDRIHVANVISAFVRTTTLTNFGAAELLEGASISVVISQSEAPSAAHRAAIWFARGEGVLYKWTLNPTGATGGQWVAMSTRREHLALIKGACLARSLVWPPGHVSEYNASIGRHNRITFSYAATVNSGYSRASMLGPWGSVAVPTSGNSFIPVTTLGYTRIRTAAMPALGNFGKNRGDALSDLAVYVPDPFSSSWSEVGVGYLTESGASGAVEQGCFISGESTGMIY